MFHLLYSMKTKDLLIVSQLRENARTPVQGISKALNMCRATVAQRVRCLQRGIIQKYTAIVDFMALGYVVRLGLVVRLLPSDSLIFSRFIRQHRCVNNLYKAKGGADYFVEMIFGSRQEADEFIRDLSQGFSFTSLQIFSIEKDIVREAFLQNVRVLEVIHDPTL
jgi:DNA-binding Lrp family transcriptional regulator